MGMSGIRIVSGVLRVMYIMLNSINIRLSSQNLHSFKQVVVQLTRNDSMTDFDQRCRSLYRVGLAGIVVLAFSALAPPAHAHDEHGHSAEAEVPPPFVATTAKPFPQLMEEAMVVMDYGMVKAPMNGNPDHDFAAMMIPHHQGAIDMAKVELLYGKNPVLRRLAQEIIVTQGSEITVMKMQLSEPPRSDATEH